MKLAEEDGGQMVEFNADTAHHFLRRGSEISGVLDVGSLSRTAQGRGVTGKIKELYIVPGIKSGSNLDEDEMALWSAEKAREQAERDSEDANPNIQAPNQAPTPIPTSIPTPTLTENQPSLTNLGGMMLNFKPVGEKPASDGS